ncbi:unnamed protein product [Agarophyton chilense]|eukprot:gb/GEZJ01000663.1/.p1 GENE.gb/GEZJ01000663.1/~~gb/GEZJ01000663.1/.p1  ORF type:complete len:1400 (-),score=199.46 gb/GEZJ01000663.1/:6928-11031(-)
MGNTVSRSHIRDAERGVARTTRENTRRNAVPVPIPPQPLSLSSTSTDLQSEFIPQYAPRSISFPDHSAAPERAPHDAHRLRLHAGAAPPLPAPATRRRARHVSADFPSVAPVTHTASPSGRSNSAQDSLLAIAPAHPPLIDPTLPATVFSQCHAARTQSPLRVDKPPRARKVVSFNENVHVVTYPCDNSSGYSSGGEQPLEAKYPAKARRKRGRSVFRLLHRVAGLEPEPSGCFSGQYDACCGLLNTDADNACQDSPPRSQVAQTRRLDYQSPEGQPQTTENDRLSYKTKNRKIAKTSADTQFLVEGDPVADDFDYTERQDSLDEPSNFFEPRNFSNEGPIPEPANRSNSSFDISPLWQRLKHVDELDDIDNNRRPPPRNVEMEDDDEVRPVPQPAQRPKRTHDLKLSSISHSRRNRHLPKPTRVNSTSVSALRTPDRQSKRSLDAGLEGTTSDYGAPELEDASEQSLPPPELDGASGITKTRSLGLSVTNSDLPTPVRFPRSVSASKPPLPRSKSSAGDSEPSFVALSAVNHKSVSLPSSSAHPSIPVKVQGSDQSHTVGPQQDRKRLPFLSSDDPLDAKKPPLPNRKTSQLAEEKKTFMQAIAHAENVLQIPADEITHTTIIPIPQPQSKSRNTFEKGSQTLSAIMKGTKGDEVRSDIEIKPDSFGTLSSPLTPDSKTEKSFSFKSFQSVSKDTVNPPRSAEHSLETPEALSMQLSKAFNRHSVSRSSPSKTEEKLTDSSFDQTKTDRSVPTVRTSEANPSRGKVLAARHCDVQEHQAQVTEQQSSEMMASIPDGQNTHVEEREVQPVDDFVEVDPGHHFSESNFATSFDNENSAPSAGNIVPTLVDPNAAEPVALSSEGFRRYRKRISASVCHAYAEDESLMFSALKDEDQLIDEPQSKPVIPKARSALRSNSDVIIHAGVDVFEAANRAAVDINALVEQSKENESAAGSLNGLDLEPVALPGDDDYSVAPMSPLQNYIPVAGIFYGNSSPSDEALSPDESGYDKTGAPEYPEYQVLRNVENENEDSVFGSEPNTPVLQESNGWRDARPKRSRDLSEQVRDSVAVQLASLSSIHGGRGAGDRTTGKMVPEVLLRDWSGTTPIEPTVEVVDSAPNSRSSESHIFHTDRIPPGMQRKAAGFSRAGVNASTEVRDRLQGAKDRLLRVSHHRKVEERSMHKQSQSHRGHVSGRFTKTSSVHRSIGDAVNQSEGSTMRNASSSNGRSGQGYSMAFERGHHFKSSDRSRTFEPALPKAFAMDPVLQDFQVPVTRKSLSEAGGRSRGLHQSTSFLDEESYAGNTQGAKKADLGFKSSGNDARPVHLPSNRRLVSDVDHASGATREESQAFRGVVGRLVNRMQSAKRMLSTS